jgi:hypothetical protein
LQAVPFDPGTACDFRWWIPGSTTSTRLPVDAVYSAPFTLKVS